MYLYKCYDDKSGMVRNKPHQARQVLNEMGRSRTLTRTTGNVCQTQRVHDHQEISIRRYMKRALSVTHLVPTYHACITFNSYTRTHVVAAPPPPATSSPSPVLHNLNHCEVLKAPQHIHVAIHQHVRCSCGQVEDPHEVRSPTNSTSDD